MSRRSLSSATAALTLLLAACGQPASTPTTASAAKPQPRAAAPTSGPAGGSTSTRPGNYNALALGKRVIGAARASAAVPRGTPLAPVHMNDQLGVPSFMWAQPGAAGAVASARAGGTSSPATPIEAARAHLAGAAAAYGLGEADTARARATKLHDTGRGPIIVSFQQAPGGVEVFGEEVSVAMARDLSLVAIAGALSPATATGSAKLGGGGGSGGTWALDARSALAAALTDLTGEAFAAGDFVAVGQKGKFVTHDLAPAVAAARAERLVQVAGVRQVWFRMPAGLTPAWQVTVNFEKLGAGEPLAYGMVIGAVDGTLLFRKDQQEFDAFAYRVWASDLAPFLPDDGPQGLAGTPHPTGLPDGFQAPFVARKLVTLQNAPFSRNDPWLEPGATTTSGNNVLAYADLVAPTGYNTGDVLGTVSAPGVFDWAYDLAAAPGSSPAQRQAAITQLFYDNNVLHDWFYDVGFDEVAGNAQLSNHGRGGVEGDPLLAEAQDYSGLNNANMNTAYDGWSPRMQMYLWNNSDLVRAVVTAPAEVPAGPRTAQPAVFGPQAFDLAGDLRPTVPANACLDASTGSVTNDLTGKIALIDRGTCSFAVKVKAAQVAGAIGVLIRNVTIAQGFGGMGGTDASITIPSLLVAKVDGDAIGASIAGGATVSVRLQRALGLLRDGTIDNLVVAHEWGHYLTNRLVQNASGLDTAQARGMGEGWGDFLSLLVAVREEDALVAANAGWSGVYAASGYVSAGLDAGGNPNQGFYYGIRRMPYSTDFTRNCQTFGNVADGSAVPTCAPYAFWPAPGTTAASGGNAEVHNAGEVWASALWECYAALLRDTQGAAPRLTFDEANRRMREYLVAGLKLTPQSPTFLEGRDALLAAARAGDPADYLAFWTAFTKRGFGVAAVGPTSRYTTTNEGVVESFTLAGEVAFGGVTFGQVSSGCDDQDGKLDEGEAGTFSITLRNLGSADLPAVAGTITSTNGHVTFPGGTPTTSGTVAFGAIPVGGTGTGKVSVALAGATALEVAAFRLGFPAGYLTLPAPLDFSLVVDADVLRAASATDRLEGDRFLWTPGADPKHATGALFEWFAGSAADHYIYGPDVGAVSDLTLTSPPLVVGPDRLSVDWDHRYQFESDGAAIPPLYFDGGVVELSDDGGQTWNDVGAPAYAAAGVGGVAGTLALGGENPLEGREAFVDGSPSLMVTGTMDHVSLDLSNACTGGTSCLNKTVRFRFRIGSDIATAGQVGWLIDNVAFGGLVNTPFDLVVPDARRCVNRPPIASAGPDQEVPEGTAGVTLDASGSSDPDAGTVLGYAWLQTAGPNVTLDGPTTARPTFTAQAVAVDTTLGFLVTVSDGQYSSSATTSVKVLNVNHPPVAIAGPSQTVNEGTLVHLDAGGSTDPDGGQLSYSWIQIEGPVVTLTGADSSGPTFTAPAGDTRLVFQVTVSDGQLFATATATVSVLKASSSGGCGCSAYGSNPAGLVPLLFGLAFLRRRRARPAAR